MIPADVIKSAYLGEFKPYTIRFERNYRGGFILWGTYTVKIYGLYYDETKIAEGGQKSMTDMMHLANVAYNLGIIQANVFEEYNITY